jgi:hypothetical protein
VAAKSVDIISDEPGDKAAAAHADEHDEANDNSNANDNTNTPSETNKTA